MTTHQQPPPAPPEPPPIIQPQSTLPARYQRRRRSIWRNPDVLIGGFLGLLLSAILLWYFGPQIGITPPGANKHAIKSMIGYQFGSNKWNIKNWGAPFSMDGYQVKSSTYLDDWKPTRPGIRAYPFEMETYTPAFGWAPKTYVGMVLKGEVIWCGPLKDWFKHCRSPLEQREVASLHRGDMSEYSALSREVDLFEKSLRRIPLP